MKRFVNVIIPAVAIVAIVATGASVAWASSGSTNSTGNQSQTPQCGSHHGQMGMGHRGAGQGIMQDILTQLNVSQQTLMQDLQSGMSIADIASQKGISVQTLETKLEADMTTRLDALVKSGKLTAANESTMEQQMQTHLTQMLNQKGVHPGNMQGMPGHGKGFDRAGGMVDMSSVLNLLGINQQTLMSDRQSGMSLADIAKQKGVSEQTLITTLESDFKNRLDQAVKNGKLTTAKEQQMESQFASHVQSMIEQKGVQHAMQSFGQSQMGQMQGLNSKA